MRERDLDRYVETLEKIVLRKERQIKKLKTGARLSDLSRCMAHGMVTPFRTLERDVERLIGSVSPPGVSGARTPAQERTVQGSRDGIARLCDRVTTCCRVLDGMLDNLIAGSWTAAAPDETVDLNRVVERFVDQLRDHDGDDARKIVLRLNRYIPPVEIRECDCYLVVHNLLVNALEAIAGRENGRAIVKTERRGDCVMIEVCDNGPGVPGEISDDIFKPYFSTKWMPGDRFRHPGLGLYTAARIVEQSGGRIEFASTPEETEFTAHLPIRVGRPGPGSRREGARGMETKTAGLASTDTKDEGITGIVG